MDAKIRDDLEVVSRHFQIEGAFLDAVPYGTGHINDTYASRFRTRDGIKRYIHQRINQKVFKEPEKVMENIERVTRFARQQIQAAGGNPDRETLTLIPTLEGNSFYRSGEGDCWRTYRFIDGARSYDVVDDLRYVYSAARAFGNFQKLLSNLPGGRLHETIPNFHHTRKRFETFLTALQVDVKNRAKTVREEINFILQREADVSVIVDLLEKDVLPERVTHNDTKINNVLIDDQTGEGVCVLDLDTMMPGAALYDFGDMIRSGTATAAEDEKDLSKVGVNLDMFDRLARGYLEAARDFLTPLEWDNLVFSGKLITLEQAIRFLTDYLNGDVYYRIHYADQNLDRTRTQVKMVAEMEHKRDLMGAIVDRYRK